MNRPVAGPPDPLTPEAVAALEPVPFFIHVMKTGGMALGHAMVEQTGREWSWPQRTMVDRARAASPPRPHATRPAFDPVLFRRIPLDVQADLRLLRGHYPFCVVDELPRRFRVITVLRDPVERVLSYLRGVRQRREDGKGRSAAEVYDDPIQRAMVVNHQVRVFSVTPQDRAKSVMARKVVVDRDRLEQAKAALARVEFLGLTEDLPDLATRLDTAFGWRLDLDRRPNRTRVDDVLDPGLRERIEADNRLDVELYDHAQTLLGR